MPVVSQVMQFVTDVALPVILKVVEAAVPVIRGVIDSIGNICLYEVYNAWYYIKCNYLEHLFCDRDN